MRNFVVGLVIGLLLGVGGTYLVMSEYKEKIEVPVYIEVPVPAKQGDLEPIEDPEPLPPRLVEVENPINKELQKELEESKTLVDSFIALRKFTVKRSYRESFEDSFQTITVDLETTGTLDKISAKYETKPYTIPLDTTVSVEVPRKAAFYAGGSILSPYKESQLKPSLKGAINFLNKKHTKIYNFQLDPINETAEIGVVFRL